MPIEILYLLIGISIGIVVLLIYKSNVVSKDIYLELERKSHDLTTQNQILQDQNNRVQFEFSQNLQKLEETRLNFTNLIAERSTLQATLENARQQFSILKSDLDEQKKTNTIQQFEITELSKKLNTIESDNRYLLEKLQTHKKEIEDFRNQSMTEFQNMANKIMEEKSIKFTQTNKDNIENLLKPLGENLDSFKKKVEETYDKESKQRFSLEDRIKELIELNNRLSNDAKNLTSALKGDAKKMGNWGEIILESILDQSGLQKNREYVIQESLKDEEGREFRPDVMVYLPEERTIVIDSKVSLVAYDRFCSSDSKEEQTEALKQHIQSIKNHIEELSRKKYEQLAKSLDFVMMFIPIEPAYMVAIQADRDLWSFAYNKRVLLISPTNLIAALKLIADLWKRESQNRNAIEIAKQGERLLDKFLGFAESMEEIGKHLNRSSEAYGEAIKKLRDGKGNLVDHAMKLKKLGLTSRKSLPNSLLSFDQDSDDTDNLISEELSQA